MRSGHEAMGRQSREQAQRHQCHHPGPSSRIGISRSAISKLGADTGTKGRVRLSLSTAQKGGAEHGEMLELLEDIPSEQWKNALKLLMTYRLRREELRHLEPRKHPKHGVQMFCTYRKACGSSCSASNQTETAFLTDVVIP